jgi:hypothetical protein
MYPRALLLGVIASAFALPSISAANLDRAIFTEVVNRVSIIKPSSKKTSVARSQQVFAAPNVLRTGVDSRAEMVAADQTVTRVGQNTLFSFEPNSRGMQLQRGSVLFQSSNGNGGGIIRAPAASAEVIGTTMIVTTTPNGGLKVLVIEGKGRVKSGNTVRALRAGEMVYALPGGTLSGVLEFRLREQSSAARLVSGFARPLPTLAKIQAAIGRQEKDIASGKATATNLLASGSPSFAIRVDVARDTLVHPPRANSDLLSAAAASDAVVDSRTLEESRLFPNGGSNGAAPGSNFTANFGDDHSAAVQAEQPTTFLANNIRFDAPRVSLEQAQGGDLFQFAASNDIHFARSTDFTGFHGEELQLLAGRTISAVADTDVTAEVRQFTMLAIGDTFPLNGAPPERFDDLSDKVPLELDRFTLRNMAGNISVIAGALQLGLVSIEAADTVRLAASHRLLLKGRGGSDVVFPDDLEESKPPNALARIHAGREARIESRGDAHIERAIIAAPTIRATSERVLKLTTVQLNDQSRPGQDGFAGVIQSAERTGGVFLFGKDLADLQRVNFFANDVLIQSRTVRLEEVRFRWGSRVILESALGRLAPHPNHNAPVQPGMVNYINNVRYGEVRAQAWTAEYGDSTPPKNVPGIVIRSLRNH